MHQTASLDTPKPEWIRLPRAGAREPYSGLSRSHLCVLIAEGKVKSRSVRARNKTRGVRLINFDSLMAFIEGGSQ